MWITNGAISDDQLGDVFLVYARTDGNSQTKSESKVAPLTLFIVQKGDKGFSLGQRIKGKLGMRASPTAELIFEDCVVPLERRVGKEGEAVRHMMRNLEIERLSLAGMSLGIARKSLEIMNNYSRERQSFGSKIIKHGQIQTLIADSYAEYQAGRAYAYSTATAFNLESSSSTRLDSDGVKLYCAAMAKRVADRAIQVLGGNGYMAEYHVERLWRDAKLIEIGGGTNEAHQKNIAKDLGSSEK